MSQVSTGLQEIRYTKQSANFANEKQLSPSDGASISPRKQILLWFN